MYAIILVNPSSVLERRPTLPFGGEILDASLELGSSHALPISFRHVVLHRHRWCSLTLGLSAL